MNADPPNITDHVQGVLTDSRHHHTEAIVAHHQGEVTGDHHLRGGAMRRGGHRGGARTDNGPRKGIVTADRPLNQTHPLKEYQRCWLRNCWEHQV